MGAFNAYDNELRSLWIIGIIITVTILFGMEGQYTQGLLIAEKACMEKDIGDLSYSNPMMKSVVTGGQAKMMVSYFGCFLLFFYIAATAKESKLRSSLVALAACPGIIYYIMDGFMMKNFIDENKDNKCYNQEINKGFYHGYFTAYPYKWVISGLLLLMCIVGMYRSSI